MLDMLAGGLTQRGIAHVRIDGTIASADERQVLSPLLQGPPCEQRRHLEWPVIPQMSRKHAMWLCFADFMESVTCTQ